MITVIAVIVALLVGLALGMAFGYNTATNVKVVQTTTTRHTKEFNSALRDIEMRLNALPEELIDAVREAFPQLYEGPKPWREK